MYKTAILNTINSINEIPTMLSISLEVDRLARDPRSSATKISDIIRLDPALTGKVLKIANSAIYASARRIVSLQQAIARLGFVELRRIVMSIAIINSFNNYFINYEKFWLHSISTAYLAVELNNRIGKRANESALYIGGLLHDVGILVLDQYFTQTYKKVFEIASNRRFDLQLVEQKILGISHADVGNFLLTKWKIPKDITNLVAFHHAPQKLLDETNALSAKLVYLANIICNNRGIHNGTGFFPEGFYDDIWEELGLNVEDVDEIIASVEKRIETAKELLRLGGR
ncbi:MAG: HDOD domain-containing protein [Candidatus Cloacimonetes bacterium]|nr:HDOD domain-containing protein [Candidatus Cloacimonadota bacterium]